MGGGGKITIPSARRAELLLLLWLCGFWYLECVLVLWDGMVVVQGMCWSSICVKVKCGQCALDCAVAGQGVGGRCRWPVAAGEPAGPRAARRDETRREITYLHSGQATSSATSWGRAARLERERGLGVGWRGGPPPHPTHSPPPLNSPHTQTPIHTDTEIF